MYLGSYLSLTGALSSAQNVIAESRRCTRSRQTDPVQNVKYNWYVISCQGS